MGIIVETRARRFQFAAPLDEDFLRTIDENIGYGPVGQQRLERAQAE